MQRAVHLEQAEPHEEDAADELEQRAIRPDPIDRPHPHRRAVG